MGKSIATYDCFIRLDRQDSELQTAQETVEFNMGN